MPSCNTQRQPQQKELNTASRDSLTPIQPDHSELEHIAVYAVYDEVYLNDSITFVKLRN